MDNITTRQYYAGQAMNAFLTTLLKASDVDKVAPKKMEEIVDKFTEASFVIADRMIYEESKNSKALE